MELPTPSHGPWRQSPGEELANSISHAAGLLGAAVGAPVLLEAAVARGSAAFTIGAAVFAATMVLLYLGSAVYHFWPRTPFKSLLQKLDHSAIFLLIAGTYTPFALGPLRGPWGWAVLATVWTMAACGVILKTVKGPAHRPRLAVTLYLVMGWMVLLVIRPLALAIDLKTLLWLIAGGLVYTSGVFFFVNDHKRYCHFVWHLFVLGGTVCHYFAVLSYAA
ncbi:MAG: PAQR family membrane homeostasis protein TrhA [Chthoniobacterales bacterium]